MLKRGLIIFIILILSLGFVSAGWLDNLFTGSLADLSGSTVAAGIYYKSVSEWNQFVIICGYGKKIQIRTVDYCSKKDSNRCNICPGVNQKCHNKQGSCVFWPTNDNCNGIPYDPHPGFAKQLSVTYDCVDDTTYTPTPSPDSSPQPSPTQTPSPGTGGETVTNPKIEGKLVDACYRASGSNYNCNKHQDVANEYCRIANGVGYVASSYTRGWGASGGTIYLPSRLMCGSCSFYFTSITCSQSGGGATYSCTGTTPSHATSCNDDTGLTSNLAKKAVNSCTTARKCEWDCNNGYHANSAGTNCVADTPTPTSHYCSGGAPGGASPGNAHIIRGPLIYTSGYTPTAWTYSPDATTSTPCMWKCSSGYTRFGNSCQESGPFSCEITSYYNPPTTTVGTITGPSTYTSSNYHSQRWWTYSNDATTSTPCKWKCDTGYHKIGNTCQTTQQPNPTIYSCIGNIASPSTLCSGDDQGLTQNTDRILVDSCTNTRKCEYTCNEGYIKQGDECGAPAIPQPSPTPSSEGPTVAEIQDCLDKTTTVQKIACILGLIL